MTLHQPFYELDKQNIEELNIFLGGVGIAIVITFIIIYILIRKYK